MRTRKAFEKETAKVKRALYKHSASNDSEIVSPDFGGNIAAKRGRRGSERESPNTSLK